MKVHIENVPSAWHLRMRSLRHGMGWELEPRLAAFLHIFFLCKVCRSMGSSLNPKFDTCEQDLVPVSGDLKGENCLMLNQGPPERLLG